MESFSTHGLPAARKVSYWNTLNSAAFTALEIKPRNPAAFDGELRREPIGPLTLMDVYSAAVSIRHDRAHIARLSEPSYLLLTPLRGDFALSHGQRRPQQIDTGEYCLLDHARPYELRHGDGVRALCLDIPRSALDAVLPKPDAAIGRVMNAQSTSSRILTTVLREIGDQIGPNLLSGFTPSLAQGLLGIIAAAYTEGPECTVQEVSVRARGLHRLIELQLADSTLCPDKIAREAGISMRRLRAVLAADGESFSAYVLRRRLERSASLLRDPTCKHHTITDIAYRVGFNNATHFGYAFKQKYAATPSDYRR